MFSDKKDNNKDNSRTNQNRINEGTFIKGDISSSGYFRIDGNIEGNIKTPSKVVIGKTGEITGTLSCENADIEGKIKGNLNITGTLTLKSTAHIEGEVVVGKLAVEPGATFNATCSMRGSDLDTSKKSPKDKKTQNNVFDRSKRTSSKEVEAKTN